MLKIEYDVPGNLLRKVAQSYVGSGATFHLIPEHLGVQVGQPIPQTSGRGVTGLTKRPIKPLFGRLNAPCIYIYMRSSAAGIVACVSRA